ncbi:MAG: hypothetical protein WC850_03595 [Candidatus Gracilibacteria bacterium]
MFKKIILFIFIFLSFFLSYNFSYGVGTCNLAGDIGSSLEGCLGNKDVIQGPSDLRVESGFKDLVIGFIETISIILAILAVGSIAYGSMVIVTSIGNEEKIKKGRNIIQWALVGFLILVSASGIIKLIIYIIYGL